MTLLPALLRFCRALTAKAEDADDLLQATLERLLERPAPADADLSRWAHRVARNLWVDRLRAEKVRATRSLDDQVEEPPAVGDAEQDPVRALEVDRVERALAALPEAQREVLALVAIQGFSYRDAADALDVPTGTVMSRLARARTALATLLEGDP